MVSFALAFFLEFVLPPIEHVIARNDIFGGVVVLLCFICQYELLFFIFLCCIYEKKKALGVNVCGGLMNMALYLVVVRASQACVGVDATRYQS